MTIHKLLYEWIPRKDGTFYRQPISTDELQEQYDLIVVDEVSMVDKEMWQQLLQHKIYVVACGDPGQLSPVSVGTDVLEHPHIFLDEIMRQAQESEIIRLSMDIRMDKTIKPFRGKEINIVRKKDFTPAMLEWANQSICAMNKTRTFYNNIYRQRLFGEVPSLPQGGERCICLKNNWDIPSSTGDALVNGLTGTVSNILVSPTPHRVYGKEFYFTFTPDDGTDSTFDNVMVDYKLFTKGESTVNANTFNYFKKHPRPNEFTYSYIITAWKAQGSEWPKVLVMEEYWPWDKEEHKKYLYTACTRAEQKLTLVLSK